METRAIYDIQELEIRRRGGFGEIIGSFAYRSIGVIRDRGKVRKETIARGAFDFALDDPDRPIDLLHGHSFDRPLASRRTGSLTLESTDAALTFRAKLPVEARRPTWMQDAVLAVEGGLIAGISPGFRVPPTSAVANAEELIPEPDNPGVFIRRINHAVLRELSLTTAPVYADGSAVDLRSEGETVDLNNRRLWLCL